MSNTFGRRFRVTTWGESHGPAIGCVVDGCPSGLALSEKDLQAELDRRKPGKSGVETARSEPDKARILSGVFNAKTTGAPISIIIDNTNADSSKYERIKDLLRPSQADYAWKEKYGNFDFRGGGRASARETASRVAAGAIAKKILATKKIDVIGYSKEIAGISSNRELDYSAIAKERKNIESNPVRARDRDAAERMEKAILSAKEDKDSVGGIVEVAAVGVPAGLGEPVYDKLSSDLARALMSIPGAKGFEIGGGFSLSRMRASEANDAFVLEKGNVRTETNYSGGILGGISNGMPIVARVAFKPTASIAKKQRTVDVKKMKAAEIEVLGRHDPCIVPRAVPVVEAMTALVLADHCILSGYMAQKI